MNILRLSQLEWSLFEDFDYETFQGVSEDSCIAFREDHDGQAITYVLDFGAKPEDERVIQIDEEGNHRSFKLIEVGV